MSKMPIVEVRMAVPAKTETRVWSAVFGLSLLLLFCVPRTAATQTAAMPRGGAFGSAQASKYFSMLRVVTANWVSDQYGQMSWEQSVWPVGSSYRTGSVATFQWYEASIWPEQNTVHLYKFNQTFDTTSFFTMSRDQWIAYRESYRVAKADIPAGVDSVGRSRVLREAFKTFYSFMSSDTPAQHYGLYYNGHGSGDGALFEGQISASDARDLLSSINTIIGKRLDLLNMGGNCSEGTAINAASFYPYVDYMLASDLPIGGYVQDDWTFDKFERTSPDYFLPLILTPDRTVVDGLTQYLTLIRQRWTESRTGMTAGRTKQSLSLYKMDAFLPLAQALDAQFARSSLTGHDVGTFILSTGRTDLWNLFTAFRIGYQSNKDFFTWDQDSNGLSIQQTTDVGVGGTAAPGPPSALTASTTGSTVTLMWIAPTTGGVPTSYVIEAGSSEGRSDLAALSTGSTSTVYTATPVASGRYFLRIKASNAAGTSTPSNELTLVVGSGCSVPPGPPSGLAVTGNSAGAVSLAWSAGAGAPSSYVLAAGSSFGLSDLANLDLASNATVFAASGVGRGTYYLRVYAKNACGLSGPSNETILVVN